MASNDKIRVALDWTPNTIHTGLFLAQSKGYFSQHNLDIELLIPDPSYSTTPARRVEQKDVDLCICPSESCIAYQESGKMKLTAIYAILQKDASAIVTLANNPKVKRLSDLSKEDCVYGTYNARYEDHIVRTMITHDGGDGTNLTTKDPKGKFGLFPELLKGSIDATWVFLPWEGEEAKRNGHTLNTYIPGDHGVPYGYSPVIAYNKDTSQLSSDALKRFLKAVRLGYEDAIKQPKEAVTILREQCPDKSIEFLESSQQSINEYYVAEARQDVAALGRMDAQKWSDWLEWLKSRELVKAGESLKAKQLYTNEFL